jgi:hypothetical protein
MSTPIIGAIRGVGSGPENATNGPSVKAFERNEGIWCEERFAGLWKSFYAMVTKNHEKFLTRRSSSRMFAVASTK